MTLAKTFSSLFLVLTFLSACGSEDSSNSKIHYPNSANSVLLFQNFDDIYEPSGVVRLADGRMLIIEDEKEHPFSLLELSENDHLQRLPLSPLVRTAKKEKKIKLDDLEGVTVGDDGWVYAITSHSRNSQGKSKKRREHLVRFHVSDNQLVDYQSLPSLTESLSEILPNISMKKLNIEGLAYNSKNNSLLLGFRRPLIDDKAIVVQINQLDTLFNTKDVTKLSSEVMTLDLQGKSIRSLNYDPVLQGFLIIAGSKKTRGSPFRMWIWKEGQLSSIKIQGVSDIGYTEGTASIKTASGESALLLVQDDGQRGESTGHYLILPYEKLQINQ